MKISKKQLRQLISESFKVPANRFGFMGQGFHGGPNTHDPYAKYKLQEEEAKDLEDVEPVEDAWESGENLEQPVDHAEIYAPDLVSVSESKLRKVIRRALIKGL
jgi:hypothetical protein